MDIKSSTRRDRYRVPAPGPCDYVVWPESFGTRFTVCVDTEEEFDWTRPLDRNARGTHHMAALPATAARFKAAGVPLTYLIDHPIATCARSVDTLRALAADGMTTIGTQLHPWVNPPFEEKVSIFNSFTGNLPTSLQAAKLDNLTDAIAAAFGARPIVYRAGRYGIGPETLHLLAQSGYRIDTSMRSGYDYSAESGPDFTAVPNHAFHVGNMVELPLTSVYRGAARRGGTGLYRALGGVARGRAIASRLGLIERVALTPEGMPVASALEAVRIAVGEGVRLLNFSFHSPSVEPGHTPYVRTREDLEAFHRWWDGVFVLLDRLGVAPVSMADIVDACGGGDSSARGDRAGGL